MGLTTLRGNHRPPTEEGHPFRSQILKEDLLIAGEGELWLQHTEADPLYRTPHQRERE